MPASDTSSHPTLTSAPETVSAVTLARRPSGVPQVDDFELRTLDREPLAPGRVRVRVRDLSLDPYLISLLGEGHMGDSALPLGAVVPGRAVAEVVEVAGSIALAVGDLVVAETGWRSEAVLDAAAVTPVEAPEDLPASAALGVLGMPGLTAYAAHVRHLRPKVGDTVVVSAATGGVGSLAGALARLAGARTVAVVGSREKARVAVEEVGYDEAVVRTEDDWVEQLRAACPARVDGYLHMADQATLDGVLEQLAIGARVSLVGVIDQTLGAPPTRLRAGAVMGARATVHGMVVYDHHDLAAEHRTRVAALLRAGQVTLREHRFEGLEQAARAFHTLMTGANVGKVVVGVS
ncbi:MDR family NADP-dependent oxidoreductase [Nocardioides gansuensis]|uniref:MDR family NADP-dependent oxidoreductase n=1 Tax=Nocardioides gansuensis TaxID=2138300 RepID=UPI001057CFA2|nr:NADP-dependent oxidoreductase [Nocardioides gansuensis]